MLTMCLKAVCENTDNRVQLNSSYDIVHKVGAANGLSADLHEFLITPEGTALMTMYQILPHDVTEFRDFDPENSEDDDPNYIWDCVFQEVSVDTGVLLFEWRASEHVNVNETYHGIESGGTLSDPYDWFHMNSIEKDDLGNYLISARYTHSITYINGVTGDIIWTLGGKRNDFMDLSNGYGINFAWQHDARFLPIDAFPNIYHPPAERAGYTTRLLTLFDNAAEDQHYEYGLEISRGMLLEVTYRTPQFDKPSQRISGVDLSRRQDDEEDVDLNQVKVETINGTDPAYAVRLIKSYVNPKAIRSSSQGSLQVVPQGQGRDPKVLVGYGLNAVWTEFDSNGTVLCDAHFGADTSWERGDIQSYRVYKFAWTGQPETLPSVDISDDDVEVYVSWNGATEVVDWVLQCAESESDEEKDWADVVRVPKRGFETTIQMPDEVGDSRYLRIIALDEHDRRLPYGTSRTIDRGFMSTYIPFINNTLSDSVSKVSPLKILLIIVTNVTLVFVLYELYRRYLSWRLGRPGAGPVRWRKDFHYRLLSES